MTGDDAEEASVQEALGIALSLSLFLLCKSPWTTGLARAGPPDRTKGVYCSFLGLHSTLCGCHAPAGHGDLAEWPPRPEESKSESECVSKESIDVCLYGM